MRALTVSKLVSHLASLAAGGDWGAGQSARKGGYRPDLPRVRDGPPGRLIWNNTDYIGIEYLLLGLICDIDDAVAQAVRASGVDTSSIRRQVVDRVAERGWWGLW